MMRARGTDLGTRRGAIGRETTDGAITAGTEDGVATVGTTRSLRGGEEGQDRDLETETMSVRGPIDTVRDHARESPEDIALAATSAGMTTTATGDEETTMKPARRVLAASKDAANTGVAEAGRLTSAKGPDETATIEEQALSRRKPQPLRSRSTALRSPSKIERRFCGAQASTVHACVRTYIAFGALSSFTSFLCCAGWKVKFLTQRLLAV